jgi:serine/threonine protein kinase
MAQRWSTIHRLFSQLIDLTPSARSAALKDRHLASPSIVSAVGDLVQADLEADSFLEIHDLPPLPTRGPSLHTGMLVNERYRIESLLGIGGMSEVYRAFDIELRLPVAIKVLSPDVSAEISGGDRLRRELKIMRMIQHPNVCRVFDLGTQISPHGQLVFLTMELLHGDSLGERLRRSGQPSFPDSYSLALQITSALAAAHAAGVIHRDLKPSNILLEATSEGRTRAVVLDFGIARRLDDSTRKLTSPGFYLGTPAYMAPEQFQGESTPASDVYALGLVLMDLRGDKLTRRHRLVWYFDQARLTLASEYQSIAQRCIRIEPGLRYPDAPAVAVLRALQQAKRRVRRRRFSIAAVLLLAVILPWVITRWRHPHSSTAALPFIQAGINEMRNGLYWSSTQDLSKASEINPENPLPPLALAQAWLELDEWDRAQDAALQARMRAVHFVLPEDERLQLEGLEHTLLRDWRPAINAYRQRIEQNTAADLASAWLDLARAYFRAQDAQNAVRCYRKALDVNPNSPLASLRLGTADAAAGHASEAWTLFEKAEHIYRSRAALDGVAQVLLQKAHWGGDHLSAAQASEVTQRALKIAQEAHDPYLEVKCRLQLSTLAWKSGTADQGREYASQALQIAREARLTSLLARSYLDLGSAQMSSGLLAAADDSLRNALDASRLTKNAALRALALLSLASLDIRRGNLNEGAQFAEQALPLFENLRLSRDAASTRILIGRVKRDQGDYDGAESIFRTAYRNALQHGPGEELWLARESLGIVLLLRERYQDALELFSANVREEGNRALKRTRAYGLLNYASALWKLGNYGDAERMLQQAGDLTTAITGEVQNERAEMLLSQLKYHASLRAASAAEQSLGSEPSKVLATTRSLECIANG